MKQRKRGMKGKAKKRVVSVGMKILLGVALRSTVCIGGLVYAFWQANEKVAANVNEVLTIRQQDSAKLRTIIVAIQDKMLSFTQYLKVNPENEIRVWLDSNFKLIETVNLQGRDSWRTLFDRTQRHDLTKHRAVVLEDGTTFSVSFGVFGVDGAFADSVESRIYSLPGGTNIAAIKTQVDGIVSQASEGDALKNNLAKLGAVIADDEAEFNMARAQVGRTLNKLRNAHQVLRHGSTNLNLPRVTNNNLQTIYEDPMVGLEIALHRFIERAEAVHNSSPDELNINSQDYIFLATYGPHALANDELSLYYQPQVNSVGKICTSFSKYTNKAFCDRVQTGTAVSGSVH